MRAKVVYILIFLMLITLCSYQQVFADVYSEYEYKENEDGGVTIVRYIGTGSIADIPSEINGRKVTRIGENAFSSNTYITGVNIPNTVTCIEKSAFWNVNGLNSITIPNSVKVIGDAAFAYCFGLEKVNFGAFIEYIGVDAFVATPFYNENFKGFDNLGVYSNGAFIAIKDQKFGLIDMKRNIVLPFEYENILPTDNNLFEVKKNGKWFYIDSNFQPVVYNHGADIYKDLNLHLEISEILPEERANNTETIYHSTYGIAGKKKDLLDYKGNLNIVYEAVDSENIYITRFDDNYTVTDTIKIARELPIFGTAICDDKGNYYILYGAGVEEYDRMSENIVIAKYNYEGKKLGQASYIAGEMSMMGTKHPFAFGSASMAISQNIIAAHFARTMFQSDDGLNHQSSTVVYADINTMKPIEWPIPYASHSLDQYIIPSSGGGFILEDRGDAYPRAFALTRVTSESSHTFESFHFAESETYQLTRSELGGLAETTAGYVLAANSIKELTYIPIPNSETISRNVFIQVIKKNFMHHEITGDKLISNGAVRVPDGQSGTQGLNSGGQSYFLPDNIMDSGVVWLTDYSGDESATNPKLVKVEHDACAVLWEKFKNGKPVGTYYAIVDGLGNIVKAPTLVPNAKLTIDKNPLFINGEIVWSVIEKESQKISVYRLKPN
jgi:hypothetical protein